ncbi:hypothetical protein H4R24_005659 [Coemansia sp. RSA 988]|nr:hypothetical protein H4R24_005659 [Coemansia sp. RSA 988]
MISRTVHMRSLSSRGVQATEERTRREDEAKLQVSSKLFRCDVDGVLKLAKPLDKGKRELADAISACTANNIESFMRSRLEGWHHNRDDIGNNDSTIWTALKNAGVVAKRARKPACLANSKAKFIDSLDIHLQELQPWIDRKAVRKSHGYNERAMYLWIQHFHLYVAHHIRRYLHEAIPRKAQGNGNRQWRLVLPYARTDTKAKDSDDNMRADMALVCQRVGNAVEMIKGNIHYNKVFAIVEAKAKLNDTSITCTSRKRKSALISTELDEGGKSGAPATGSDPLCNKLDTSTRRAFQQLFMYTRQLYVNQPDRRFAWGITVFGTEVRVCIFTSGGALASHTMDISSDDGRRQYICLLVDWSLCEWHQLGYDPTVQRHQDLNCWEILVPPLSADQDGASNPSAGKFSTYAPTPYYFSKAYVVADRLFGRHTRCYPATSIKPAQLVSEQNPIVSEVLVKDAWSFVRRKGISDGSGERGEIEFLKDIKEMLESMPELRNHLPMINCGGTVCVAFNGEMVNDNADSVLGELHLLLFEEEETREHFYSHTRMAMSPIGQRLREVQSVFELIIVVYDALKAHAAVLDKCQILHQDISENNILFQRDESGNVMGMLIDFDNAVDSTAAQNDRRPICAGTLPFMSLNNLRRSDVPRTVVDDMESILYLLIWLGVWGVTSDHRRNTMDMVRIVSKWGIHINDAMDSKKYHMSNTSALAEVLEEFYNCAVETKQAGTLEDQQTVKDIRLSYKLLKGLVLELRAAIFNNPGLTSSAHGTSVLGNDNNYNEDNDAYIPVISIERPAAYNLADKINGLIPATISADPHKERSKPENARKIHLSFMSAFKEYIEISRDYLQTTSSANN